ncbi:unnamed protein product, partial [Discosporangium mesarthrocarpum]
RQEQEDLELALRLQREEEEQAKTADRWGGGGAGGGGGGRGGGLGSPGSGYGLQSPRNQGGGLGPGVGRAVRTAGGRPDGECLARISVRTLLVKKWKPTYFIFELPDLLLLYRSRDDYIYNPKGTMIKKRVEVKHNHTLTRLKQKV